MESFTFDQLEKDWLHRIFLCAAYLLSKLPGGRLWTHQVGVCLVLKMMVCKCRFLARFPPLTAKIRVWHDNKHSKEELNWKEYLSKNKRRQCECPTTVPDDHFCCCFGFLRLELAVSSN